MLLSNDGGRQEGHPSIRCGECNYSNGDEYVEEARERAHQVAIASGTGHVQDNGGKILAVFRRVFGHYGSYPT